MIMQVSARPWFTRPISQLKPIPPDWLWLFYFHMASIQVAAKLGNTEIYLACIPQIDIHIACNRLSVNVRASPESYV